MTAAADPTIYWAVLTRPRGEILIAEAQSPGLHLGLLGVPAAFSAAEAESWLYDIIGVAHEGSPAPGAEDRVPGLLHHALTGLVFSHAELWDRGAAARPCSFAFVHTVHEVGFGLVGDARVVVRVDGVPFEPEWIAVRDELGREARGWSTAAAHGVEVRIEWDRPGAAPGTDGADVDALWSPTPVTAIAAAPAEQPAARGDDAPAAAGGVAPDAIPAGPHDAEQARGTAVARWLRMGFTWLGAKEGESGAAGGGEPAPAPPDCDPAPVPTAPLEAADAPWELPERIPPSPEPAELTARTAAWSDPPDPHAIELPLLAATPATAPPRAADAGDLEFGTVAFAPPEEAQRPVAAAPASHAPPQAPVSAAMSEAPAIPPSLVSEPPPPPAPQPPEPTPAPIARVPEVRAAAVAAEASPHAARTPRRLVFQTEERTAWPTMRRLARNDLPPWRRPWVWAIAVLVLFAAGWMLGGVQENAGPRDASRRGFVGTVLHAIGLGGPRYRVDVSSRPTGAWIVVNGRSLSLRTPAAIELAPGEHEITLSFQDLGEATYRVRGLKGDRVPLQATLWGALEVYSPDAVGLIAVTVDGEPRGMAPLRVDSLSPGIHELRFNGPGGVAWGQTVDIRVGETREVLARAVTSPSTGVLQVQATLTDEQGANPLKGAQVWIDGELRGLTPLTLDLPQGPHSVRVVLKGQEAPVQVIDLPGGNQRFAVFEFGLELDRPSLLVELPTRLPRDRPTVISASLQGAAEVREMWLHTQVPGGPWRRYPMTIMKSPSGLVGVATFPLVVFDAQGRARYYVSAMYGQGDESFTEIRTAQLDKPAR